jgi:hypothetical protein
VIYTLALKGFPGSLEGRLSDLPWETHTSVNQHNGISVFQIGVADETTAEKNLLRFVLYDPTATITEFKRKKYELEEVFMRIVKGDSHDLKCSHAKSE